MQFESTFVEADGRRVSAVLDADSEQALHEGLARNGRLLLTATAVVQQPARPRSPRLPSRKMVAFTQSMETSLEAGVSILQAFESIRSQETDPRVAEVWQHIIDQVSQGEALADAMAAHPRTFTPLYCAMVRAGETSGTLDKVFASLGRFLEWRAELRAVAMQAMIYPLVVCSAAYGLVVFMLSFVIPRIAEIIRKMVSDLPPASRLLLLLSDLVQGHLLTVLVGTAACVTGLVVFARTDAGRQLSSSFLSRLPLARNIIATLNLAELSRTLAVLLESGLSMVQALDLSSGIVSLPRLRQGIKGSRQMITDGARISDAFAAQQIFPPLAMSMIKVGEEAGSLPTSFQRLGVVYDRDAKSAVKVALGVLEPAVTVMLGVIVGGVAAIVITTLYKATQGLAR
jgi:type II secretory pathway component PulF